VPHTEAARSRRQRVIKDPCLRWIQEAHRMTLRRVPQVTGISVVPISSCSQQDRSVRFRSSTSTQMVPPDSQRICVRCCISPNKQDHRRYRHHRSSVTPGLSAADTLLRALQRNTPSALECDRPSPVGGFKLAQNDPYRQLYRREVYTSQRKKPPHCSAAARVRRRGFCRRCRM